MISPCWPCTNIVTRHSCIIPLLLSLLAALGAALRDAPASGADEPAVRDSALLVLTNGRVVSGELTPRTNGYEVTVPGGNHFIPSESVRFFATDIDDAYEKMRASLPQLTPDDHISLARWCHANQLYSKARRELLDALHLDPYRDDAQRMLNALQRFQSQESGERADDTSTGSTGAESKNVTVRPSRSLGGLSKPLARDFGSRIQPLLANKCGNATCHGGAVERPFMIHPLRNNSRPYLAEQNLAAVLNQIDFDAPHQSPLLKDLHGLHGGSRTPLFRGRYGAVQIELLNEWVLAVAAEIAPQSPSSATAVAVPDASAADRKIVQASAVDIPEDQVSARLFHSATFDAELEIPGSPVPHGRFQTIAETDQKFLREAENANRSDAFDPDLFNRRFHPDRFETTTRSRKDSR